MGDIKTIQGINCYEENGVAYLNLEAVARGLGFSQIAKSGNEVVRWETVRKYLSELSVSTSWDGDSQQVGKEGLPEFIPENIFYRLAMKAKNKTAERFQTLIADEVIPAIRKNGAYLTPEAAWKMISTPDAIIQMCQNWQVDRQKLEAANERIAVDAPKVLFADSVAVSKTEILVGELAKILKQNGVAVGPNRLFETLRSDGYLINRKGLDWNMPTQRSMELGLMRIKETSVTHSDGHVTVNKTPKVTGKGQIYFVNRYAATPAAASR
ncbi:MAG: phage antirepressor KilAC domain-containing protein [Clostridia bacterium]